MSGLEITLLVILAMVTIAGVVNMVAGPFLSSEGKPKNRPLVSVLIPARNEEHTLPRCLESLRSQAYAECEIIVCDDHSSDGTEASVLAARKLDGRVRLLAGKALPQGWTGKNWACWQLAREARGEVLLFMDADVECGKRSIEQTLAALERLGGDALSAFPEQKLVTPEAKALIPMMDVLLYGFLILQLVHRTKAPSVVAANGQWMAFKRSSYDAIGTHEAVRGEVVEDMALARRIKAMGKRFVLVSGAGSVSCAMYETLGEIIEGFSKNFYTGFGQRTVPFVGVLMLFLLLFALPSLGLFLSQAPFFLLGALLNLVFRTVLSLRLRHGALSVLLHPLGAVAAVLIGLNALRLAKISGTVRWKDRDILLSDSRRRQSHGGSHHGC